MRLRLIVILGSVAFVVLSGLPASAIEQGVIGTIGPKNPLFHKSFGPLAGVYPGNSEANLFATFKPPECAKVTYCDSFELAVDYPASFERTTFFGITITLDWKNARTQKNTTGNDLDLFLGPDNGPTSGGPSSKCSSPRDTACDNLPSETITVTEPDDTARSGNTPMYFTVVNDAGVNTGYTISVKWYTFTLPPPPEFHPPQIGISSQPGAVSGPVIPQAKQPTLAPISSGPASGPRTILVPGPDGKLHEITLPPFAAGAKLTANDTKPPSPWLPAFIVGGIVLIGLSTYLVFRARREDRLAG